MHPCVLTRCPRALHNLHNNFVQPLATGPLALQPLATPLATEPSRLAMQPDISSGSIEPAAGLAMQPDMSSGSVEPAANASACSHWGNTPEDEEYDRAMQHEISTDGNKTLEQIADGCAIRARCELIII